MQPWAALRLPGLPSCLPLPCLLAGISAGPGGRGGAVHRRGPWPLSPCRWAGRLPLPGPVLPPTVSLLTGLLACHGGHQLQRLSGARRVTHVSPGWVRPAGRPRQAALVSGHLGGRDWGELGWTHRNHRGRLSLTQVNCSLWDVGPVGLDLCIFQKKLEIQWSVCVLCKTDLN